MPATNRPAGGRVSPFLSLGGWWLLARAGFAAVSKGMRDEHLADRREWIAGDAELVAAFEQGLAEGGDDGAHRRIADLVAARLEESGQGVAPRGFGIVGVAQQYLFAGDPDRTIDSLEKAYEVRTPNLLDIGYGPLWDPLRSDPRFQDLLRRMNLPTTSAGSGPADGSLASGS